MARVTRPGGSVIALAEPDYEARIDYPPPLTLLGAFQRSALDEQGVDIAMGRKLPGLFHKVGLKSVTTGILGAQWSQAVDSTEWITIQADLEGQFSQAELMNFHKIENDARQRGDRVLFIPTFYAAGVVTG
jgi:hypothetical protein